MNPKNPITLLKILSIATILVASDESSFAFGGPPGGPFSNGSYFPNDGTFSAVVRSRAQNLTGILQFSTTAGPGPSTQTTLSSGEGAQSLVDTGRGVGSTGVSTIYYNGDTYLGNSQGSFNPAASKMNINFQAGSQGQGNVTFTNTNTTSNSTITTLYFDALYLNGFANCSTSNSYPNQKFEGVGEAEFQHLVFTGDTPFLDAVTVPVSVSGVRLSNTASAFNTTTIRPPSVNQFTGQIKGD